MCYERASKRVVNATCTLHSLSTKAENNSGGKPLQKKGFPEVTEKLLCPFKGFSDFSVRMQMTVSIIVIRVSVYRKHGLII